MSTYFPPPSSSPLPQGGSRPARTDQTSTRRGAARAGAWIAGVFDSATGRGGYSYDSLATDYSKAPPPRRVLGIGMNALAVHLLMALTILVLYMQRERPLEVRLQQQRQLLCDPFAEPGYVNYDEKRPKQLQWVPYRTSCPPAPDYLAMFERQDLQALSFLQNRTILVLGDSVDRNGLQHLAEILELERYVVPYEDVTRKGFVPEDWDERGLPWVVEVPWLDLTFTNGFFYGLDDVDNFGASADWHAPGLAESRIEQLFKVHTDQLRHAPSFISLHSGLWDLALFGRQDKEADLDTSEPLSVPQQDWWQERLRSVIEKVQTTWGVDVPLWLRKLHRVGEGGESTNHYRHWHVEGTKEQPNEANFDFFTDLRTAQIRGMQDHIAAELKIPIYDFGSQWEGLQKYQDAVHPQRYPGGPMLVLPLIHHIWMESQGREKWSRNPRLTIF